MKNLRDSYKFYKKLTQNPIGIKEYLLVNGLFNKFIIQKVLQGVEISLPARMGKLSIVGKKQKISFDENGKIKGLAPDWVKTKQLWESNEQAKKEKTLVYHTNAHTDNVRYRYVWSKLRLIVKNRTLYSLRLTRTNKRAVHSEVMKGKQYKTR